MGEKKRLKTAPKGKKREVDGSKLSHRGFSGKNIINAPATKQSHRLSESKKGFVAENTTEGKKKVLRIKKKKKKPRRARKKKKKSTGKRVLQVLRNEASMTEKIPLGRKVGGGETNRKQHNNFL